MIFQNSIYVLIYQLSDVIGKKVNISKGKYWRQKILKDFSWENIKFKRFSKTFQEENTRNKRFLKIFLWLYLEWHK